MKFIIVNFDTYGAKNQWNSQMKQKMEKKNLNEFVTWKCDLNETFSVETFLKYEDILRLGLY